MVKIIIAHELGHAVSALAQDTGYIPTIIELSESKGALAACYMDEFKMDKPGPFGKYKGICDLGGIFGEILFQGHWNPWGARQDLDNFITANPKLVELDYWMWLSVEDHSFHKSVAMATIKDRRLVQVDSHETYTYVPFIWEAYCDFCERIDKEEFINVVNELHKNKTVRIEGEEIVEIGRRILL